MSNLWDSLVDCICRPPRDTYSPSELLGGSAHTFMVGSMEATRLDFELLNKAGEKMLCSHYLPLDARSKDGKLPVVVYCHCNSGSRRDAEEAVWHLLPCGVGVVAFDFTGSGLSDGKWVTLGAHEVDDLAAVVQHLRAQGGVSSVGLWGRSMGAVTALLYSHKDPDIAGMVLDSPFSRLTDLMLEIVVSQRLPIPKVMLRLALKLMRSSVKRKAGADINAVSPLDVVGQSLIPAMFGHGEQDSFINIQHSVKLHQAYNAQAAAEGCSVYKNLVRFRGDHNHPRPAFFYSSVCCFFHQQLKLDEVLLGGNPADAQQLLRHGSLNMAGEPPEQVDRANGFINTPWSLGELSPEQQAAAAAALMRESDSAGEAAPAAARCTAVSSGGSGGPGGRGYNPRAVLDGNQAARVGAATNARLPVSSRSSSSSSPPFMMTGDDLIIAASHHHQQQQRQTAAVVISGSRAAATGDSGESLSGDLFQVGSRGCLHTVPLLAAEDAESDGPLGSPAAMPGSGSASSSEGGMLGPFGKLLRRPGASNGPSAGSNQSSTAGVVGSAAAGSAGGPLQAAGGGSPMSPAAKAAAAMHPEQQQQQSAPTAGWLGAVGATGSPVGADGSSEAAAARRRPVEAADWATARDDADPLLAAAIAASLREYHHQQPPQQLGALPVAGEGGGGDAAQEALQQKQQQERPRHGMPASAAEEEEMLRQAIELSLSEAAVEQQQQGADAACEAVIVQLSQQHKPSGAADGTAPAGAVGADT